MRKIALGNLKFQVIFTWLWMILFPLLAGGIVVGVLRINIATVLEWWRAHQYLQGYLEAIAAGLLPALFVWTGKEHLSDYGLQRAGLARSVLLSLLVVAAVYLKSFLTTGEWIGHSSFAAGIGFPWNLWHAILGIFANGPLEVFFFIWLTVKTGQLFRNRWAGFFFTLVVFALVHILTTQSVINALNVFGIFLFLGAIYQSTRNALGPMLGWTLINVMVWAYIEFIGR